MAYTKVGNCNNCGACCYVYSPRLKRFHLCEMYSVTRPGGHCLIHGKQNFPKECAAYPRSPMDLERVQDKCCIQFVDEKGCVVDPWMDKKVILTKLK
jgi:hypothetical protein